MKNNWLKFVKMYWLFNLITYFNGQEEHPATRVCPFKVSTPTPQRGQFEPKKELVRSLTMVGCV